MESLYGMIDWSRLSAHSDFLFIYVFGGREAGDLAMIYLRDRGRERR